MNGENPMPKTTYSAPQPAEKRRPNKSKQLKGLLVKVGQNKMYAQALEKLRKTVNPYLWNDERGSGREAFTEEVEKAVQGVREVRKKERQWTLEIRDIPWREKSRNLSQINHLYSHLISHTIM
ncbi:hypothetical protein TSAR_000321 [Trichomalopsis sarcophagae]|uniref:Uncharacterized protein n=1 Tax=Trichomalopsis sarcophagae TaxID=543379 RepID=A0A232EEK8_9HYME|nr:hypothetical protein TSAR_000321 [Trichomalopsis sarcophagae]